ncbi:Serine/threonine-protein phosphatase 4 regulatory subunit 4 [Geranomyces variabilis]|nr:Serine/threonine-protein phosphatase 4 regulatory subunit 4 [Geranomyces variabilis]
MAGSEKIDWDAVLGFASESLDTQIKGTDEHKLSNKLYKTEEEIGRYMVDEKLDDIDRAVHLLRNGAAIQKHSVAGMLTRLLTDRGAETKTRLLPVIASVVLSEQPEMQVSLGKALSAATEQGLVNGPPLSKFVSVARTLMAKKDEEVAETWSEVLLTIIGRLAPEVVEKEILPDLLLEEGLAQPSSVRLWRSKVIGVLAPNILKLESHQKVFQKAITLCQDTDYEVRACTCRQLNALARAVGHARAVAELLPEYVELIMDEECVVRVAAIDNCMQLMDFFEPAVKVQTIIPVWKKLCEEQPPRILQCLARQLGLFLWETREQLPDSDLRYFTNFYHSLSTSTYSDDETREMCAYNFPALVKCVATLPQGFESHRLDIAFEKMVSDPSRAVRRRLAAGLHDVAAALGSRAWPLLRAGFLKLFGDPDVEVYKQIYRHLGVALLEFVKCESVETQLEDVLFLILRRERECATYAARSNWRLHQDLLAQFQYFPDVFGLDLLHGHCVPLLFKTLHENVVLPIKQTIVACVCTFLKYAKRTEHRDRLYRHMYDLKDSPSYHVRLLFVELCAHVLTQYSARFFRESFFTPLLDMVRDPVANVRLRVVPLLPEVRRQLRKAQDSAMQARVTDAIGALIADDDADVSAAAKALPAGDSSAAAARKAAAGFFGEFGFSRSADSVDGLKEEEEQKALAMEWETEEAARRREMDDARHEFAKQLAEKAIGKKGGKAAAVAAAVTGTTASAPGGKAKPVAGTAVGSARPKAVASVHVKGMEAERPTTSSGNPSAPLERRGVASSGGSSSMTATSSSSNNNSKPTPRAATALPAGNGSPEYSRRAARSASTGPVSAAFLATSSISDASTRLPGLRAANTSPRAIRSARVGAATTTTKASLAPMRRSQELLNHGFGGGSASSSSSWGMAPLARNVQTQPKTALKLSPLQRGGAAKEAGGSIEVVAPTRRTAAEKDAGSKSGFLVK